MDCDHDSFRLPWMYRAQTPCNLTRRTLGVKPPSAFLDDGTTLSLNPGKMKSQGKKKWYVTSSRTHIKGSKSYQMNRVRERKRARQTQCSKKMVQIAWTLISSNITWPKHTIGLWSGWRFYVRARFNARYKMMRPPHFTTKCMLCSTIAWSSNDPHVSMVSNMRVN